MSENWRGNRGHGALVQQSRGSTSSRMPPTGNGKDVDLALDTSKMYTVEWKDGTTFGFTMTPVKSDHGTVLLLTRRTARRTLLKSVGLDSVVPGDMLIAIGEEKVYDLGAENASDYLQCVRKPVRLTFQLSPYGATAASLPSLAPNEYNYNWQTGSLGVIFEADAKLRIPVVKRVKGNSDNVELLERVEVGDQLVYVNDIATCEYSMSKIMDTIKALPKPIQLRFRKPLTNDHLVKVPELGRGEYDFLWEFGPLGLVISESPNGLPLVRSFTGKGTSPQLSLVRQDDEIIMVNDKSAKKCGFPEIMRYLTNVPKPAVIRFRRPSEKTASDPAKPARHSTLAIKGSVEPRYQQRKSNQSEQDDYSGKRNGISVTPGSDQSDNRTSLPTEWFREGLKGDQLLRHGNKRRSFGSDKSKESRSSGDSPKKTTSNQDGRCNQSFETVIDATSHEVAIDEGAFYQIRWTDGPFGLAVREMDSDHGPVMLITKRTGRETCVGLRRVAVGDIMVKIGDQRVVDLGFEQGTRYLKTVPKPVTLVFQAIE